MPHMKAFGDIGGGKVKANGFASLSDKGWTVNGDYADIDVTVDAADYTVGNQTLTQSAQSLNIKIQNLNDTGFRVVAYTLYPTQFDYNSDSQGGDVWQGGSIN